MEQHPFVDDPVREMVAKALEVVERSTKSGASEREILRALVIVEAARLAIEAERRDQMRFPLFWVDATTGARHEVEQREGEWWVRPKAAEPTVEDERAGL